MAVKIFLAIGLLHVFCGIHGDPDIAFDIQCFEDRITGTWSSSFAKDYVQRKELLITLANTGCNNTDGSLFTNGSPRSTYTNTSTDFTIKLTSYFDECETTINNSTADKIIVNNTALLKYTEYLREGLTSRVYYYQYDMTCSINRNVNISTGNSSFITDYNVTDITKSYNKTQVFEFDLAMDFYTDESFTTQQQPGQITVNSHDVLYVRIHEKTPSNTFKIVVNQCAASPTEIYDATKADVFFNQGCRLDSTFERLTNDSHTDEFSFKIQVFSYITEQTASYFHCQLYICQTDSTAEKCQQRCLTTNQRQRRDTTSVSAKVGDKVAVTSEKIVFNRDLTCADVVCAANAACHPELKPARCICDQGYIFSRTQNTCSFERQTTIENIHLDQEWNPLYVDTTSVAFYELAFKYENVLYKTIIANNVQHKIEGVRVIRARKGSVILDTKLMYAPRVAEKEAFNEFVASLASQVLSGTNARRELKYIGDTNPTFVSQLTAKVRSMEKRILAIVIVLVLTALLIIFLVILMMKRRQAKNEKQVYQVEGVDNVAMS